MAKRRRKSRKSRKHRTGSLIVTRRLSGRGIGRIKNATSGLGAVFPPLLGGGLAAAGAWGLRMLAEPAAGEAQSDTQKFIADYANWLGVGVGFIGAIGAYALVGAPQGVAAAAGSVAVGGALAVNELLNKSSEEAATEAAVTAGRRYMRGVGAVVPQLSPMTRGTGAIVMSPVATQGLGRLGGAYQAMGPSAGEVVTLGAVNTNAFGTPGFTAGR